VKLVKNFGPVLLSDIISTIIGSVFWLYLATILTKNEYGELQFLISNVGLAVGFAMIANNNSVIVYEAKRLDLRRTLFLISFLIGGIVSVVLFIIYSRFDIILLTFGMMSEEMIVGYFIGKKFFVKYAIFIILQKGLMIALGIGFYLVIGIEGILYGIGLSYISLIPIIFRSVRESKFNFLLFRENFGFIINNYGLRLIVFSRRNLDKIIIVPVLGTAVLGEYALAIQVYTAMVMFTTISNKFLLVNEATKTNSKFKILVLAIAGLISLLGVTIGPRVISTIFPNYSGVADVIPIFSLTVLPNAVITVYSSKFLGEQNSRVTIVGAIIHTLIYIFLIIFLGSSYGLFGLSVSFLVSSIFYAIFLVSIHRIERIKK